MNDSLGTRLDGKTNRLDAEPQNTAGTPGASPAWFGNENKTETKGGKEEVSSIL